jgi:hypothetical protein
VGSVDLSDMLIQGYEHGTQPTHSDPVDMSYMSYMTLESNPRQSHLEEQETTHS